jgi:hypothetical protein
MDTKNFMSPEEAQAKGLASLMEMAGRGEFIKRSPKLLENKKVLREAAYNCEEAADFRAFFKNKFGYDPLSKEFPNPLKERNFDWKGFRRALKIREADSETTFTQFLRAGIQNITLNAYETVDTVFEEWTTAVQSTRTEELYAPNHGIAFPNEVPIQGTYPEVGAAALDIKLRARKFGAMYPIEKELLNDDQTGSFARQAALLGEYLKVLTEVWVYGKLASAANMKYINLIIPTSETKPSTEANYPYSQNFIGGGSNRPAAFGAISQANIQTSMVALLAQKNLQGIRMQVEPRRLLIGPKIMFDTAVLVRSSYYPSGAQAAGVAGGAFAINPLGPESPFKTIAEISVSRYMFNNSGVTDGTSTAWYLCDDSKPFFIVQYREPVSIVQEAPDSGQSFDRDIVRFKASTRMNADYIDPRFIYQGNDGSV